MKLKTKLTPKEELVIELRKLTPCPAGFIFVTLANRIVGHFAVDKFLEFASYVEEQTRT